MDSKEQHWNAVEAAGEKLVLIELVDSPVLTCLDSPQLPTKLATRKPGSHRPAAAFDLDDDALQFQLEPTDSASRHTSPPLRSVSRRASQPALLEQHSRSPPWFGRSGNVPIGDFTLSESAIKGSSNDRSKTQPPGSPDAAGDGKPSSPAGIMTDSSALSGGQDSDGRDPHPRSSDRRRASDSAICRSILSAAINARERGAAFVETSRDGCGSRRDSSHSLSSTRVGSTTACTGSHVAPAHDAPANANANASTSTNTSADANTQASALTDSRNQQIHITDAMMPTGSEASQHVESSTSCVKQDHSPPVVSVYIDGPSDAQAALDSLTTAQSHNTFNPSFTGQAQTPSSSTSFSSSVTSPSPGSGKPKPPSPGRVRAVMNKLGFKDKNKDQDSATSPIATASVGARASFPSGYTATAQPSAGSPSPKHSPSRRKSSGGSAESLILPDNGVSGAAGTPSPTPLSAGPVNPHASSTAAVIVAVAGIEEEVILMGHLLHKSSKLRHRLPGKVPKWSPRYCVLTRHALLEFDSESNFVRREAPRKEIELNGCSVTIADDKVDREFAFGIFRPYRKGRKSAFYLAASGLDRQLEWVRAIQQNCMGLNMSVGRDDFETLVMIGEGATSKVLQVRKRDTGEVFAMKQLKTTTMGLDDLWRERTALELVQHPFIIHMHFTFQTQHHVYFVMDFINGGELLQHIQQARRFTEKRAQFYATEVALALEYLHSVGIIYRDLKPENVLLDSDGHIVLTDMGLSVSNRCKESGEADRAKRYSVVGSMYYMAPEVVMRTGHDCVADWWGLGILIHEMIVGLPPFYTKDITAAYRRLLKEEIPLPAHISDECRATLSGLLQRDPHQRLGYIGHGDQAAYHLQRGPVLQSPWFCGLDLEAFERREIDAPMKPVSNSSDVCNFDDSLVNASIDGLMSPKADDSSRSKCITSWAPLVNRPSSTTDASPKLQFQTSSPQSGPYSPPTLSRQSTDGAGGVPPPFSLGRCTIYGSPPRASVMSKMMAGSVSRSRSGPSDLSSQGATPSNDSTTRTSKDGMPITLVHTPGTKPRAPPVMVPQRPTSWSSSTPSATGTPQPSSAGGGGRPDDDPWAFVDEDLCGPPI